MRGHQRCNVSWAARAGLCFASSLLIGISVSSSFVAGLHGALLSGAAAAALVSACQWQRREVRRRLLLERLNRTVLRSTQRAAVRRPAWRVVTPGYRRDVTATLERSASVRAQYAALVAFGLQHVGKDQ